MAGMTPDMQTLLAALEKEFSISLAELKAASEKEFNGTHIRWLKDGTGKRMMMAACITGEHEISKIAKAIPVTADRRDWRATRLMEVIVLSLFSREILVLDERDENNRLTALALISADPASTENLADLLGLNP